jgi:SAM-dependent methyltransferase
MRLEPADWALVHDRREPRHFAFWRGLDLCTAACAEQVTPGALWADVGAGTGHLAATLAALGARVIGLDFDPRMALYARRRWSRPFAAAAASALPLADGSCAGLVAVSLLGCMPEPAALCAEAARVLAPGGTLCLTAMNRRSLLLAAAKLWTRAAGQRTGRYTAHDPAARAAPPRGAGVADASTATSSAGGAASSLPLPPPAASSASRPPAPPAPGRARSSSSPAAADPRRL